MQKISKSPEDTKKFATEFVAGLGGLKSDSATVVGLFGNLGAGKTTFVQYVAEILGVEGPVTSPTFVILKNYPLNPKPYTLLVHIDAYRLKNGEELKKLGFKELLNNPGNLILIEWPENVTEVLPKEMLQIRFEFMGDSTRKIEF